MEMCNDCEWVNCYVCGKAASVEDALAADGRGRIYHPECYEKIDVPKLAQRDIDRIISDPFRWLSEEKSKHNLIERHRFLLTFTRNEAIDVGVWKNRVRAQLQRKAIKSVKYVLEHKDTNIHCHALVETDKVLRKREFRAFEKTYGYVDVKNVKKDNGLMDYFTKEEGNEILTDLDKLI